MTLEQDSLNRESIVNQTETFVKAQLAEDATGHDWWHVDRVRKLALEIGQQQGADLFVVELAALLHDIADWKFHSGDDAIGPERARQWLAELNVEQTIVDWVTTIVKEVSFKGAEVTTPMSSLEGRVVQDADRLDALGAIGIARAFAYGGFVNQPLHDPRVAPTRHASFEAYKNSKGTTINHFHEKLLLLKDCMNTDAGKRMAEERSQWMENFLTRFFKEWNGEK